MNEPEDLLADVLADTASADFRAALLGETLHHVRRRRRWRQTRRAAVAAIALAATLIFRIAPRRPPTAESVRSYELVATQPLPATAVVATKPLASEQLTSSSGNVPLIETETAVDMRLIDDDQLLALAPGPAALVRLGPASAELIFADPVDENGFPLN